MSKCSINLEKDNLSWVFEKAKEQKKSVSDILNIVLKDYKKLSESCYLRVSGLVE